MGSIRNTTHDLEDLATLVIKAMVLIVIVVIMAKELLGILLGDDLGRWASYLMGITSLFVIVVSSKVRREIVNFGKR